MSQQSMIHCKKIMQWARLTLPHVGLVVLLMVYTVAGAAIFQKFEEPHERNVRVCERRLAQTPIAGKSSTLGEHCIQ